MMWVPMQSLLPTIIGFAGAFAVLAAFAASAAGRISSQGVVYHVANGAGGLCLVVSGFAAGAWPSVATNVIWAVISVTALSAILKARRPARQVRFEPPTAEYSLPTAELALPR
jgi:hypothetical protein